jgi:hypothetical protein
VDGGPFAFPKVNECIRSKLKVVNDLLERFELNMWIGWNIDFQMNWLFTVL